MAVITTTMDKVLPRHIDLDVFSPYDNLNWNTISPHSSFLLGRVVNNGADGTWIEWKQTLIAGTWDIEVMTIHDNDTGKLAVKLDGVQVGTLYDPYSVGWSANNRFIRTATVASTGVHTIRIQIDGKNASSSGYYGKLQHVQLRCTSVSDTSSVRIDPDTQMPWHIDYVVFMTPPSHTNWNSLAVDTGAIYNGVSYSSGVQNDQRSFDVPLAAGTWSIEIMHSKGGTDGICSVRFDGNEVGTIDFYSSSRTFNNRTTISGITVASTGIVTVALVMASKNASASNYYGRIQHIQLRRTA